MMRDTLEFLGIDQGTAASLVLRGRFKGLGHSLSSLDRAVDALKNSPGDVFPQLSQLGA